MELAARLGRGVRVIPSCCSIAVGEEVMALDGKAGSLLLDLDEVLEQERRYRQADRGANRGLGNLSALTSRGIKIVGEGRPG